MTITHSAFYTNTTGYGNGGAVYATSVSTVLDDVEFSGNAAPVESSGGAVYAGWGSLAVSNATFRHNNAEYQGGAIYTLNLDADIAYTTFYSNTAHTGGGVHVGNGMLDVTQSTFRENEVSSNGGGLYAVSSVVTVTQSDFYSNTTLYSEGAGLSMPYSKALLEEVHFQGNEAQSFGGGDLHLRRRSHHDRRRLPAEPVAGRKRRRYLRFRRQHLDPQSQQFLCQHGL